MKSGDLVALKSGGPVMTLGAHNYKECRTQASWFDADGTHHEGLFDLSQLQLAGIRPEDNSPAGDRIAVIAERVRTIEDITNILFRLLGAISFKLTGQQLHLRNSVDTTILCGGPGDKWVTLPGSEGQPSPAR